jgi:hypothetical protein
MRVKNLLLASLTILAVAGVARAEDDLFLNRDGGVSAGSTYLESDGAVVSDTPADSPWETWTQAAPEEPERFEIGGPWAIKQTAPQLQTLVFGPTFRNEENRTEVGAGFGYVNSKWRFPFELSFEPTWRRNKRVSSGDRDFARFRTAALVELWGRSSDWESTSIAVTGFWDAQESSFNSLEFGGAVTQVIGRRLAISGNLDWGGFWPHGDRFHQAAIGSVGTSYNLGAGLRVGGFYEPDNNLFNEDDWGGFISYQFLPFAELDVNAGKNEFVLVRLRFSYALERP